MSAITLTRTVSTDATTAYAAWTDADTMRQWFMPDLPDTTYDIDAQVGGSFAIASISADLSATGTYTHVEPGELLDMTWVWNRALVPDRVAVLFTPLVNGGTEVTVVHISTEHLEGGGAVQGWTASLDHLVQLMS